MNNQSQFFIAGGSLEANTRSYVVRSADRELLKQVQAGAFCYVLTARQMGKSSLMVHTATKLQKQGFKTPLVDITTIGTASAEEWFLSFLTQISRELDLKTNVQDWWQSKTFLSVSQRFINFMRDIVLSQTPNQIVLFIDEIDAMLRLDFRDDFFAAIRAIYNARARDPNYRRLTVVLLGVATPIDLVQDTTRTPFNIGNRIELYEFSYSDALPLREGLDEHYPGQGDRILKRIFYWTNGHPYLTQKLCLTTVTSPKGTIWNNAQIDHMVANCFFSDRGTRDANLAFVHNSVASVAEDERQEMLRIYSAVYDGRTVDDDESSPAQNHLELFGLVRIERGKIHVRNEIYRRVFDKEWIQSQLPKQQRSSWFLPGIIAILAIIVLGGGFAGARAIGLIGGSTPTSITVIDTPTVATTAPPVDTTPAPPTTEAMTPEPPTDTPTPSLVPTETPTRTITPTPTDAPPATNTPTPTATNTPIPIANCVVQNAVTIRQSPGGASTGSGLEVGTQFSPEARNSLDNRFVWVKIPGSGWVYAGTSPKLVRCTGLENVPLIETP